MPTIAESSIDLNTPIIPTPVNGPTPVVAPVARPILRASLPPSEVLDTVTAAAGVQSGALPVWKTGDISAVISQRTSALTTPNTPSSSPGGGTVEVGVPQQVINVQAEQTGYKTPQNIIESLVTVTFGRWANDPYFAGVQIWFTGYHGNPVPVLMAESRTSPAQFTCDPTGETVTITVVAYGPTGLTASFVNAPTTKVALTGTQGPPPAPTINQPVTALAGSIGWQFSWNVINGLIGDAIDGYWIYRSSTDTTPAPPASRINYVKQPVTNIGALSYTDVISGTYYYWVSAVSVTGFESTLTSAQSDVVTTSEYPTEISGWATSAAYDGNESTASSEDSYTSGLPDSTTVTETGTWYGFANPAGTAVSKTLKVMLGYTLQGGSDTPSSDTHVLYATEGFTLRYSLDGGSTWSTLLAPTFGGEGSVSSGQQYYTATLSTSQDLTLLQVQAITSVTSAAAPPPPGPGVPNFVRDQGYVALSVYEIRVDVVQESV